MRAEEFAQLDCKWHVRTGRLPFDGLGEDLGPVIAGPPTLDEARVDVNNPILQNSFALIPVTLHTTIEHAPSVNEAPGGSDTAFV